jgi:hypothetical protein
MRWTEAIAEAIIGIGLDISIAAGASWKLLFPSEQYIYGISKPRVEAGSEKLWALGWIEYTDSLETLRRTGPLPTMVQQSASLRSHRRIAL